jgi:hypothetical protein
LIEFDVGLGSRCKGRWMSFNCFQHAICVEATYGWFANLEEANVQIVENVGMFDFGNPCKNTNKNEWDF